MHLYTIHLNTTIQYNWLEQGCSFLITSGVPSKDELSDFIINKDEKRVGEGTEPPVGPVDRAQNINQRSSQEKNYIFILYKSILAYLSGYILRATSMPGQ